MELKPKPRARRKREPLGVWVRFLWCVAAGLAFSLVVEALVESKMF